MPEIRVSQAELLALVREAVRIEVRAALADVTSARPPRVLLSLRGAARSLGISHSTLQEWIARKRIKIVPVGARFRVPATEIERIQREGV